MPIECNCCAAKPMGSDMCEKLFCQVRDFNREEYIKIKTEQDPWKHRSKGMKCLTCMWFVRKEKEGSEGSMVGRCRRHAPSMNGYPVCFINDWCGDHKLDETKI